MIGDGHRLIDAGVRSLDGVVEMGREYLQTGPMSLGHLRPQYGGVDAAQHVDRVERPGGLKVGTLEWSAMTALAASRSGVAARKPPIEAKATVPARQARTVFVMGMEIPFIGRLCGGKRTVSRPNYMGLPSLVDYIGSSAFLLLPIPYH
jgi:hypothetical protein